MASRETILFYNLRSKVKSVPCIVFFVHTTTDDYSEKCGSFAHVQRTHACLFFWRTFPRPFFSGLNRRKSSGQRAAPPMLRRNRKSCRHPSEARHRTLEEAWRRRQLPPAPRKVEPLHTSSGRTHASSAGGHFRFPIFRSKNKGNPVASARLLQRSAATGMAVSAPEKPAEALRRKPGKGDQ